MDVHDLINHSTSADATIPSIGYEEETASKHEATSCSSPCQSDFVFHHALDQADMAEQDDPDTLFGAHLLVADFAQAVTTGRVWQDLTSHQEWKLEDAFCSVWGTPTPATTQHAGVKRKAESPAELMELLRDPNLSARDRCRTRQRIYEKRYRNKKKDEQNQLIQTWFQLEMDLMYLSNTTICPSSVVADESAPLRERYARLVEEAALLRKDNVLLHVRNAWETAFEMKEIKDSFGHVQLQYARQFRFTW